VEGDPGARRRGRLAGFRRDVLSRVVRGPLFTVARWNAILGLNFRRYDDLVNGTCKRTAR
jgi:hypothetical protein